MFFSNCFADTDVFQYPFLTSLSADNIGDKTEIIGCPDLTCFYLVSLQMLTESRRLTRP